ncbi:uncharacterized protein EI90DRAFT_3066848 [Cantharellus anzutake]|uniref:uncharacterized protein n=1 Tax=Cantharellus anzutake TaxID=1750568 RepID=UPI00190411EB|nr:uncharacterized protein EI90DRAFT_3066848 [Cantharellus anzutake]KAF8327736.1 hypothetical protein EI90DRAFT_3066848 [Cantharellus anzutake]
MVERGDHWEESKRGALISVLGSLSNVCLNSALRTIGNKNSAKVRQHCMQSACFYLHPCRSGSCHLLGNFVSPVISLISVFLHTLNRRWISIICAATFFLAVFCITIRASMLSIATPG